MYLFGSIYVLERRRNTQGSTKEKVTLNGEPRTSEPLRPRVKSRSDSFDFATQASNKGNLLYFRRQADLDGLLSSRSLKMTQQAGRKVIQKTKIPQILAILSDKNTKLQSTNQSNLTVRRKIRVVHILHSFGTGGLEKGVATIISHASNSFEHIVLCLSTSGETQRLLPSGTEIHELHKPPGNSLLFILKLARVLKHLTPDVVHTRNWGGIDGIIAARLAGIKSVVQGEHGWEMNDPNGLNRRRIKARKFLSSWVKEFTCVSKDMEDWLKDTIKVRGLITQIYNGVDIRVYYPANGYSQIRNELAIPDDTFVIGTVGRLDPIKDHPSLFQAVKKAREGHSSLRLLVVGDGPERSRLEKIAPECVQFLGNRTDIPDILRTLDLFVLTSLNEGISNTILEAMATGLPAVVTSVGGNPELVNDGITGTLVPPRDPVALASALCAYIKNPNMRIIHGKAGRIHAEKHFSIEKMVKSYETVYRRAADPDGIKF